MVVAPRKHRERDFGSSDYHEQSENTVEAQSDKMTRRNNIIISTWGPVTLRNTKETIARRGPGATSQGKSGPSKTSRQACVSP